MTFKRGDVVLAQVPHTAGKRGKKRPAVVIQADTYNARLRHVVVAEVTSNPRGVSDPACVFIDLLTAEGQATGLHKNSVVSCFHLVTMNADRLGLSVGRLSPTLLRQLNDALNSDSDVSGGRAASVQDAARRLRKPQDDERPVLPLPEPPSSFPPALRLATTASLHA